MKKILLFLLLCSIQSIFAQNLVKNSSFENLNALYKPTACRYSGPSEFNRALENWSCSEMLTADILTFSSSGSKCFPVAPRTGQRMAGIIAYHPSFDSGYSYDYHEHLQGELSQRLSIGKIYTFEFWIYTDDTLAARHLRETLGDKSKTIISVFCNNIGVQFRTSPLSKNQSWRDALSQNPITWVSPTVIGNTYGWKKIQFLIKADQAYKYFYLGNFSDDTKTSTSLSLKYSRLIDSFNTVKPIDLVRTKTFWERKKRIAYYCIDDVCLKEGDFMEAPKVVFEKNKTYTFNKIVFQVGKAILLPSSTSEIDALYEFLDKNKTQQIIIQGHTDNIGSEKSNQILSGERAQAVADYLIKKGCQAHRIKTESFGSTKPLLENNNEENRAKNRRVEVQIY
jgi:OmpA-OmpF porin, OOP family